VQSVLKRTIDFALALAALVSVSPLILLLALVIRFKLGSPILFTQARPGLNGQVFHLFKFRTMTDERDAAGVLLPDGERLTHFGRWLRATSLDEVPTLWNIICGDMSLVGPRPLLVDYLPLYSKEQARRHEVRPGLTGWAQVNGRNALSWKEKFALDIWYVDHQSTALDLKIIWMTVGKVLKREGISATNDATMPRFTGEDEEER
jgi:lipopolysaccharide/colanic/teichoic acid biosynthesis glycosyltransferase